MTTVRSRPDIVRFVDDNFRVRGRSGPEYSVICPVHDDHNASMRINVDKGVFLCNGCHVKGGMFRLARLVGARWYEGDATEVAMTTMMAKLHALNMPGREETVSYLDESVLSRFTFPTDYWAGRGLAPNIVDVFDLGYDPLEDAVTVPIRDVQGRLLGITYRYLDDDADLRYRDPKGFRKASNLYGSWLAAEADEPTVVLVEGLVDTMKCWQAGHVACGLFGSYLSPRQIKLLRDMGTLKVVLFFDNDQGGEKARRYSLGFEPGERGKWTYNPDHDLRKFFLVEQAVYPKRRLGTPRLKDPGMMTEAQIDRSICDAVRVR